ncbi:unnamed protein product [Moneuplotes crassus]|uniref:RING-type domain-containing protein n=1 Tax=Euplotes crassus TaxID=5936 RepID=A0AAD1X778_EUPCR|nr:unnamed protein product [Moneuplotes crassus]
MKAFIFCLFLIGVLANSQEEAKEWDLEVYNQQQLCFKDLKQFDNRIFSVSETENTLLRGFDQDNAELLLKYLNSFHYSGISKMMADYFPSGEVGTLKKTKINAITLMENTTLPDTLFIGFGVDDNKDVSKANPLAFKVIIAVQNVDMVNPVSLESYDYHGLKLKSYKALCYYCSSKITEPAPCKVSMALKTWGGYSEAKIEASVNSKLIMSEIKTSFKSDLKGGSAYELSFLSDLLFTLISFVPIIGACLIPIGHEGNLYNIDKGTSREKAIYLITRMPFYFYGLFTINTIWLHMFSNAANQSMLIGIILILLIGLYNFAAFFVLPASVFTFENLKRFFDGRDFSDMRTGVICFCMILFYLIVTISGYFKLVMFSRVTFIMLMFLLPVSFVSNSIHKSTYYESFFHLIVSSYIALFPFTPFGPFYYSSDDELWVMYFFVSQVVCITLINMQAKFGSRFILPSCFRQKYYDTFKREIKITMGGEDMKDACNFCTNLLTEPEAEHHDSKQSFKFERMKNGKQVYYKLNCGHQFHPNCILVHLQAKSECPVCNLYVGKNRFMD